MGQPRDGSGGRVTRPLCLSTCPQKLRKTALGGTRPLADFVGACPGFKTRVVSSLAHSLIVLVRALNLKFESLIFSLVLLCLRSAFDVCADSRIRSALRFGMRVLIFWCAIIAGHIISFERLVHG